MASALEWWRLPAFAEEFLPLPEFEPDEWQTTWLATGPPPCHLYFKQCFGLIAIIVFFSKALIFCNDIWRFSRISNIFLTQRIIKKNVAKNNSKVSVFEFYSFPNGSVVRIGLCSVPKWNQMLSIDRQNVQFQIQTQMPHDFWIRIIES